MHYLTTSEEAGETLCNGPLKAQDQLQHRHVLEVLWTADPKLGGIVASVPDFSTAMDREGRYQSQILAFVDSAKQDQMKEVAANAVVVPTGMFGGFFGHAIRSQVEAAAARSSVIHIHGLWREHGAAAIAAATKRKIPYVYSVHGMLNGRALEAKRWKKKIYAALIERRNLQGASALRAFTRFEAESYQNFGVKRPVVVIPNGVHLPKNQSSRLFLDTFPALVGKQLILYMGRLHAHKGLDLLVRAWSRMAARFPDVHLVLAGPDELDTKARLDSLAEELGVARRVTFTGNLSGDLKWSALWAAEMFVLPSLSEALSVGVLEALACSRPVILTRGCNFPEVEMHQAGIIIERNENDLERALTDVLRLSSRERSEMGARGRNFVKSKYSWASVAQSTANVYDWLLGGNRPSNVEIYDR